MQAAVLMVRCLEAEGVERIDAIPGEETPELVEALRESPIEIVIVRHEQGAAFMADALADELPAGEEPAFATRLRVSVTTELRAAAERPGLVSPQAAVAAIRDAMAPDEVLASDVGAHKLWLGRMSRRTSRTR